MWISVYKEWWSRGGVRGIRAPPPPLIPLIFRPNWGPKGRKKNFWRPFPLLPGPPLFEGLHPLLLCLISLVHSKNQAGNQITYHDVIRLPIVWIAGALATVHQLYAEKTTERVSDLVAICCSKSVILVANGREYKSRAIFREYLIARFFFFLGIFRFRKYQIWLFFPIRVISHEM